MKQEYHLYRAKFIKPHQTDFLHDPDITPEAIFIKALYEKPYAEYRESFTWHIGNLNELEPSAGYFAVGRITTAKFPKFDPQTGNFVELVDDTSPHTFAVYDARIGLLAIRKKSELAPSTEDIAYKIEKLLSQTSVVVKNEVGVIVKLIPNPEDFIQMIDRSYAVKSFTATFTGPNPFDADEYFQKPLAVYLNAAGGESGAATIQGGSLDKDVVTEVAKSTAATANHASAKIQDEAGQRPYRINLNHNPVKLVFDQEEEVAPAVVLAHARTAYNKVRHDD
jgi:hypothetical protein